MAAGGYQRCRAVELSSVPTSKLPSQLGSSAARLAENLQPRAAMTKSKILLVEDNADVRRLYAIGLNQRGFEVKLAANGAEAVERIADECPDYLLLDWVMPLMDGAEVVDRIEQQGTNAVEIIVISGQPPPPSLPARVKTWLTKPLTIDELVAEISQNGAVADR